jgi:glutamyl-tRNA synthetase
VVGPDGQRLAKRHGESRVAALRASGMDPRRIVAALAQWSGLPPLGRPADLVPHWDWAKLNRARIVLTAELLKGLRP